MRRGLFNIDIDDSKACIKTNKVLFFAMFVPAYIVAMAILIWYFFKIDGVDDEMFVKTLCIIMMFLMTLSWCSLPVIIFKEQVIDETGLAEKRLFRKVKIIAWSEIRKIKYVNAYSFAFYTENQKPLIFIAYEGIENIIKKFYPSEIINK